MKILYPKIFVDLALEIQLRKLGEFRVINPPDFRQYSNEKVIIYANHFYIQDVHILNRLKKTLLKDRKILIWMQEYDRYPFFRKFAYTLPFKTTQEKAKAIIKTIRILNQNPQKYYFFIFPEGVLHNESEGILMFDERIHKFLKRIEPYWALPVIFLIRNGEVIVKFGEFELNSVSYERLNSLLEGATAP